MFSQDILTTNSKSKRLTYLYTRLLKGSGATISELAHELGVSTKTIQRDLHEHLKNSGAICHGKTWTIDKKFATDDLKSDEKIILNILDELAKGLGGEFYSKAHNLILQITSSIQQPLFTHFDTETLNSENLKIFETMENAIHKHTIIECQYKRKHYKLKPLKLVFFEGIWYTLCLDTLNEDAFKKFHLKSFKNIRFIDETFTVSSEFEKRLKNAHSIWFSFYNEPFTVRLLVNKEVLVRFERIPLKSQVIESRYPDGSAELKLEATHEMEILPLVQHYIPHVKILEPQWLLDNLKEKMKNYCKLVK